MKPRIIAITGPTASGKTDLSIHIAQTLKTEIISFDSRQFYRELNIGVARPTDSQLAAVQHHFIANKSIHEPYSAASFATEARNRIVTILESHQYVVLCGGTGLYLKAILEGFSVLPEIKVEIREEIEKRWQTEGLSGLVNLIKSLDSEAIGIIEIQNPARVKRAAELLLSAEGQSLKEIYATKMDRISYPYKVFNLIPDRKLLYQSIENRVDEMMESGLLNEVKSLKSYREFPVLKTVGYTELFEFIDGKLNLNEAVIKIKQHTRNYAKRQITWFKNQTEGIKVQPENAAEVLFKIF